MILDEWLDTNGNWREWTPISGYGVILHHHEDPGYELEIRVEEIGSGKIFGSLVGVNTLGAKRWEVVEAEFMGRLTGKQLEFKPEHVFMTFK